MWADMFGSYQAENYDYVIENMPKALANKNYQLQYQDTSVLMLVSAYLERSRPQEALTVLDEYPISNPSLQIAADWYKALGLLKSDQISQARELFEELSTKTSPYKAKASALLEELNQLD